MSARAETTRRIALVLGGPVAVIAGWFAIPLGYFGPHHALVSWIVFGGALVALAAMLLRQIQRELLDEPGRPALLIVVTLSTAIVVFATAYLGLARRPGEFQGLNTKVDALYFTVITMSTVGYGDITPVSQEARIVVMLQVAYTLVFLTAGGTALSRRMRTRVANRAEQRRGDRAG